jgi:hypothetical protein
MDQRVFWGIARAHLLNVGIIRPGPHVTAIEINVYLSSPTGAPVTVGKITDQDKADVPRFLNRCVQSSLLDLNRAAHNRIDLFTGRLGLAVRPQPGNLFGSAAHCRLSLASTLVDVRP